MGLDVVGVSVDAVFRVRHHDLRLLLAQDRRQLGGCLRERCLVKRGGIFVVGGPDHARVAIAKELTAVDAEDPGGILELFRAHLRQVRARGFLVHIVDLAHLAASRRDEHDAMTVFVRLHHRAACRDRFVIRMRMNEEQSADRKSTRLNSSHANISYAVFCLKKKKKKNKKKNTTQKLTSD